MAATVKLAFQDGVVIGARTSGKIAGVALWYPPQSPYPPRWYRSLLPTLRLLPLMVHTQAYARLRELHVLQTELKPRKLRGWFLAALAVDKASRGNGLGTLLVRDGLARAAAQSSPVLLHCWSKSIPFYGRLGLVPLSSKTVAGTPLTCHLLGNAAARDQFTTQTTGPRTPAGEKTTDRTPSRPGILCPDSNPLP